MATILDYTLTAFVFLAIISVLVAAHEYGHYFFARVFGMGVEEFAIGMGKRIKVFGKKSYDIPVPPDYVQDPKSVSQGMALEGGNLQRESEIVDTADGRVLRETTEFAVRMLPIGGFVRIKGMIPQDDGSEVNIPGGFYNKPPWQRLIVLVAGPVASVVSGILVLIVLFMIHGVKKPLNEPVLGEIVPGKVAAKAGLKEGDRIVAVNGKSVKTFYDVVEKIYASPGTPLSLDYQRDGKAQTKVIVPTLEEGYMMGPNLELASTEKKKRGAIGVAFKTRREKLGLAAATAESVRVPLEALKGLLRITAQPTRLKEEAGGAVTMVRATHEATQAGIGSVVLLACLLSISIGIFNLLPVPPLDGGQMMMAFAEMLRGGRRLSIQVQQTLMGAGLTFVIILTLVVLVIDVQRLNDGPERQPPKKTAPAAGSK